MKGKIGLQSSGQPILSPHLRAYLYVVRPFTIMPAFVVGALGGFVLHLPLLTDALYGIMLGGFQASGQALNQANPTEIIIDRVNGKTYRPTVSGVMSSSEVTGYAYGILLISLLIGFHLGIFLPSLAMALMAILYSQDPFYLKRFFPVGLIVQAVARGFLPIFTIGLMAGVNTTPLAVFFLILVIGLQHTKDFGDIKGDSASGIRTLPVLIGVSRSQVVMLVIVMLAYIYVVMIGYPILLAILPLNIISIVAVNSRTKLFENSWAWVSYYLSLAIGTVIGLAVT